MFWNYLYLCHIDEKRKNSYDGVIQVLGRWGKIMEQRILQYRKQIDEWLTEMEQNVQTLSQHGEYATQAIQRQSDTQKTDTEKTDTEKTDIKKTDTEEQAMQEMVQDKLKEHLVQVGFFQHERLIHLIVTVTFALLEMLAIVLSVISDSLFTLLLPIVILILLIPYIRHYYILENEVQKMYVQYDRMRRLQQTAAGSKIEKPER